MKTNSCHPQTALMGTRACSVYFPGHVICWRIPVSTMLWPNVGSMLGHRLRRWPSIEPTLGQCIVFAAGWDHTWICTLDLRVMLCWLSDGLVSHTFGDNCDNVSCVIRTWWCMVYYSGCWKKGGRNLWVCLNCGFFSEISHDQYPTETLYLVCDLNVRKVTAYILVNTHNSQQLFYVRGKQSLPLSFVPLWV